MLKQTNPNNLLRVFVIYLTKFYHTFLKVSIKCYQNLILDSIALRRKIIKRGEEVKEANFKAVLSNKPLVFSLALTAAYFLGINDESNVVNISLSLSLYHDMPVFKLKKTHAPVGWRSLFSINKDVTHAGHYKGMEQEQ